MFQSCTRCGMLSLFTTVLFLFPLTASDQWPGFRGPNMDGHATAQGMFSGKKDLGLKVTWSIPIGSAYSGIAVAEDKVFTMYVDDGNNVLGAFDPNDGRKLWQYTIGKMYKGHDGSHDGPIGTPAIADGRVFGVDPYGPIFALDAQTGKEIWRKHLVDDLKATKPGYGFGGSPLVVGGKVVYMVGGDNQMVMAFNPADGSTAWHVGTDNIGYPTPTVWKWNDKVQIVAGGSKMLAGIDPTDGKLLWSHEYPAEGERGFGSMTPVDMGNGRLFLGAGRGGSKAMAVSKDGDSFQVNELWSTRNVKNSYTVPVFHNGYLFAYSTRIFTCIDPETGDAKWKSRAPGDGFLAVADGHLIIATKDGKLSVGKADDKGYKESASVQVFDKTAWALPTVAGNSLYVRGFDRMARVDVTDRAVAVADNAAGRKGMIADLTTKIAKADDKQAVADAFMDAQESFPVIEGKDKVHFFYQGDVQDVAVAGHFFGARQEKSMSRIAGTNLFYTTIQTKPDAVLAYLFITDFKNHIQDPRNGRKTEALLVGQFMEFNMRGVPLPMSWFSMPDFKAPAYLNAQVPEPKANDHEWVSEDGKTKIAFKVYLPEGYDTGKDYNVVYAGDMQAWERGAWKQAVSELNGKETAPFITVLVPIPPYNPKGGANLKHVVAMVDAGYKTKASPEGRALVGFGYGGMAILPTALDMPDLFGTFAMQSGFYMGNNLRQWEPLLKDYAHKDKVSFYLDWGIYDLRNPQEEWDMSENNPILVDMLKKHGFKVTGKQYNQGTDWTSWRTRTGDLLKQLFPKGS